MNVVSLLTCDSISRYPQACLFFDTLRTGFPTATIHIYDNKSCDEAALRIRSDCDRVNAAWHPLFVRELHYRWIEHVIFSYSGELVILDGDTIFWSNCEDIGLGRPQFIGGFYVPVMHNDFAKCVSAARLHTSFLWIRSTLALRQAIERWRPIPSKDKLDDAYAPFNPYAPTLISFDGRPVFYDTCAMLYNAIGGFVFEKKQLDLYDHLNCGSFYDLMKRRVRRASDFERLHQLAATNPSALRGMWMEILKYYESCAQTPYIPCK